MATQVPTRPALMTEYLRMLAEGDDRNKANTAVSQTLRAELDAVRAALDASTVKVQAANAAWRDAAKTNREMAKRARTIARRMRDAVYSLYTRDDPRIGDYGLATPVKPKSKKSNGSTSSATKIA